MSDLKTCPNCAAALQEGANFCHYCGQKNKRLNRPMTTMMVELAENFLNFDTKFWATSKALFSSPGRISREYNEEKRTTYGSPLRLYLFASFIFFLILSFMINPDSVVNINENSENSGMNINGDGLDINLSGALEDTIEINSVQFPNPSELDDIALDSLTALAFGEEEQSWLTIPLTKGFFKIVKGKEGQQALGKFVVTNISTAMFILMPIYAAILFFFFFRSEKNYYAHLVFSLHYHAFIFILLIFTLVISHFSGLNLNVAALIIFPIYMFFALKGCYKKSWIGTFFRWFGVNFIYFITLILTITLIFLSGVYNLG